MTMHTDGTTDPEGGLPKRIRLSAEQARANHPSRTGSPADSAARLACGHTREQHGGADPTEALMELLIDADGRPVTAAELGRAAAPPGFNPTFEQVADMALADDTYPGADVMDEIDRTTRRMFEEAYPQAHRLISGRNVSRSQAIIDIAIMIERGTGASSELWTPIAAQAFYEMIIRDLGGGSDS